MLCIFAPHLMFLAWTGPELSRGQASDWHRLTDAGNDNTRRPKLAYGKTLPRHEMNYSVFTWLIPFLLMACCLLSPGDQRSRHWLVWRYFLYWKKLFPYTNSRVNANHERTTMSTSWDGAWFRIHDLWIPETHFVRQSVLRKSLLSLRVVVRHFVG